MKRPVRVALVALVLMLALTPLCQAMPLSSQINGTWYGKIKADMGYGTASATCYVTCEDGIARFRAAGKVKSLTYTIVGNRLIVAGSLFGVAKDPEFTYSLDKKVTTLKLSTSYLNLFPVGAKLTKTAAKVSKASAGTPKVGRNKNVNISVNGVTEYVYMTKTDGTVIASSDTRQSNGRYVLYYDGWKRGYNYLYVYAGLYDAEGKRLVTKAPGQVLDAADKANLSKAYRIKVRVR